MIVDLFSKSHRELQVGDSVRFFIQKDRWKGWPDEDILQDGIVTKVRVARGHDLVMISFCGEKDNDEVWTFVRGQYTLGKIIIPKSGVRTESLSQIEVTSGTQKEKEK